MAGRTEARIFTSIWRDEDFLALPAAARLLYLMLLTNPELSAAGTVALLRPRWATRLGLSVAETERAIDELGEDGWIIIDDSTEDVFVSGFFRSEKIASQPRRVVTALDVIRGLASARLAAFASAELAELRGMVVAPAPRGLRAGILERDGSQCRSCGWKPGDPVPVNGDGREIYRGLEIDHVYPRSKGGTDSAANYQVLCTTCNSRKGART